MSVLLTACTDLELLVEQGHLKKGESYINDPRWKQNNHIAAGQKINSLARYEGRKTSILYLLPIIVQHIFCQWIIYDAASFTCGAFGWGGSINTSAGRAN